MYKERGFARPKPNADICHFGPIGLAGGAAAAAGGAPAIAVVAIILVGWLALSALLTWVFSATGMYAQYSAKLEATIPRRSGEDKIESEAMPDKIGDWFGGDKIGEIKKVVHMGADIYLVEYYYKVDNKRKDASAFFYFSLYQRGNGDKRMIFQPATTADNPALIRCVQAVDSARSRCCGADALDRLLESSDGERVRQIARDSDVANLREACYVFRKLDRKLEQCGQNNGVWPGDGCPESELERAMRAMRDAVTDAANDCRACLDDGDPCTICRQDGQPQRGGCAIDTRNPDCQ
ncbi:MAG: hypothetical protein HY401_05180 [Elusimicrobia bacterium]|nr:hypothetical protein [Elusimicrobiota bacterium]